MPVSERALSLELDPHCSKVGREYGANGKKRLPSGALTGLTGTTRVSLISGGKLSPISTTRRTGRPPDPGTGLVRDGSPFLRPMSL